MGIKPTRKGEVVNHIPMPRPSTMMVDVENMTMTTLIHLKYVATVEEVALVILSCLDYTLLAYELIIDILPAEIIS